MTTGKLLTAEEIKAADDRGVERVHVPEWGGDVLVAVMDGPARAAYEEFLEEKEEGSFRRARAVVLSLTIVDEQRKLLFSEADVEALDRKGHVAVDRVFRVAIRLNRLRRKDIEELEKNSGPAAIAGSCSGSPSDGAAGSPSC